jgi:hypothetical protein
MFIFHGNDPLRAAVLKDSATCLSDECERESIINLSDKKHPRSDAGFWTRSVFLPGLCKYAKRLREGDGLLLLLKGE